MTDERAFNVDEIYMQRCLQLAKLGMGSVSPNPMVGAVMVHGDRIIGEGYHKRYGADHAEPMCVHSVTKENEHLVAESTLYVSLEPCIHFGKTPPCADLIIRSRIPRVVIGCLDPFREVNGKGAEKLRAAGIAVEQGVLERECRQLNRRFFVFHTLHRPYIILKWAQTANGKIALEKGERLYITNAFTNRLVHKWRSEESSILIGTNTAIQDDPELTTRLWSGNNPTRLVVDMDLKLSSSLQVFNDKARTIVFNRRLHEERNNILFYQVSGDASVVDQIINGLYRSKIQSVMVEGGAKLLQSFIDEGSWDEARIITNQKMITERGLNAPRLDSYSKVSEQVLSDDKIEVFKPYLNSYL